jgi:hypothetical protein
MKYRADVSIHGLALRRGKWEKNAAAAKTRIRIDQR